MIGIIFYIMTAAWLVGTALSLRKALSIKNHGEALEAHIVAHETTDNKSFTPVVSYNYLGKYHEVHCGTPSKTKQPLHSAVTIIVSPKYPDAPVFDTAHILVTPIFCGVLAAFSLAVSIYITLM